LWRKRQESTGSTENPISLDDCINKFYDCASQAVKPSSKNNLEAIIKLVDKLDQLEDVTQVTILISYKIGRMRHYD
jgi:hypothetical protein